MLNGIKSDKTWFHLTRGQILVNGRTSSDLIRNKSHKDIVSKNGKLFQRLFWAKLGRFYCWKFWASLVDGEPQQTDVRTPRRYQHWSTGVQERARSVSGNLRCHRGSAGMEGQSRRRHQWNEEGTQGDEERRRGGIPSDQVQPKETEKMASLCLPDGDCHLKFEMKKPYKLQLSFCFVWCNWKL